jgi:hypothetical protein
VLDEVAGGDVALELLGRHEVVVDVLRLAGARQPRRRRDRQLQLGHALAQRADQRALADARRAGDDDRARHRIERGRG